MSRPESPTRPGWRIQAGARFTPTFSIKAFISFYQIFIFKSVATRIPDLTRLADQSWSPVYSDIFNYLSKTCCLCYSIFDLLIMQKHFLSGNPMTIYKFKPPITFTFNKMHLQNDAFLPCLCNVKDTYTNTLFNTIVSWFGL